MAIGNLFLNLLIISVLIHNVLSSVNDYGSINSVRMVQSKSENLAMDGQDSGHLISCLNLTSEVFNVTWSPKIMKLDEPVYIYFDIIATQKFTTGKICEQVWIDDIPEPIIDGCRVQKCAELLQLIQPPIPQLKCPLNKGFHIKHVIPVKIPPTVPIPPGNYKVGLQGWNEDDELFLCFTGRMVIEDA